MGDLGNREHHLRTCPKQPWRCQYCLFSGLREDAQIHTDICERVPVPCPNGCSRGDVPRCDLSNHIEKICPLQMVGCPFNHVGCAITLPRTEMDVHIQHSEQLHLMLTCSANLDLTRQLNEKVLQKEEEIKALKAEVARMEQKLGERVQAVEASLVAQSEWMESNQTVETEQSEEAGSDKEGAKSVEETIKSAIASEMEGLGERVVQSLREAGEKNEASSEMDSSKTLILQELVEKQVHAMKTVEEKLDTAMEKMELHLKAVQEEAKSHATAVKEMTAKQEVTSKGSEEEQKAVVKEVENSILQQVRASQRDIETVIANEMKRAEGGEGLGVEQRVVGVEKAVGTIQEAVTGEFVKVKTQLHSIEDKIERVEELRDGMEERIANKVKEAISEDLGVSGGATKDGTVEVKGLMESKLTEMEKKLDELSQIVREKMASPRPHSQHRHKSSKHAPSHPLQPDQPVKLEADSGAKKPIPPVTSVHSHPLKSVGEEDANCKPSKGAATAMLYSLPQERVSSKAADSGSQVHRPPCDFKIEQFSRLKEQNKEWRSPPFYSSGGYKMCMGLWPNGFRSGAGTHVSVEFYKMRDVNTDKLKWNVKLPIHVRIYNYRTKKWEREHVNGDTFTRSKVAGEFETSGYAQSHKLIAHNELDDYLLDDNFRIQIYKFEVKQ